MKNKYYEGITISITGCILLIHLENFDSILLWYSDQIEFYDLRIEV